MPLSTEIFVMCIFIAGFPFYYVLLRDPQLRGSLWFLLAYICLMLSNTFTVVEEFWLNYFFNICEHFFITLSSIMFIIAIMKLTRGEKEKLPQDRDVMPGNQGMPK